MKDRIDVSPDMVAFVGDGALPAGEWHAQSIGFSFRLAPATFAFHPDPVAADDLADADLLLIVSSAECARIFGTVPTNAACWHIPTEMRAIALAITGCRIEGAHGVTLRLAKSIELLCMTFAALADGGLIPIDGAGVLSAAEAKRIAAARRLIDEQWHEKITLDTISRACGINRAKLTRGFRSMFSMTVADAIADRRLHGARDLLLATDLPVSSIGYRCGYLNNASFTRAFSRRFGQAPSHLRAQAAA
jgi:AraC family transcriptional activator of pyochelin receptor